MNTNYKLRLDNKIIETNHFKSFKVKYTPANNKRGSGVIITDTRTGNRKTIPYNYKFNNARDIAYDFLNKHNLEIVGFTWDEKNQAYYFLTKDFWWDLKTCVQ